MPSLFAGKSLRNYAKEVNYETLLTSSWIHHRRACCNLSAQDKVGLQPNATVLSILQGSAGKTVELRLNSGEKIGGKIQQVTDNVVHLSNLTGAEYFDGFINTKEISAVVIRTAGK